MMYISILLIINLALMGFAIFSAKRKNPNIQQRDITKHVGMLELVWSTFSIMLAFYFTFEVIEASGKLSFLATAGGLRIALLTILYGFGIFHFFISTIIMFRLMRSVIQ